MAWPERRFVIVFNGAIGVGKTTLGRDVARRLGAAFIDSDDLRDPSRAWFAEGLAGLERLVEAGLSALSRRPCLIIAKPLRARDWILLRSRFAAKGVILFCVTLAADRAAILSSDRNRIFSPAERERIAEMIEHSLAR